MTPMGPLQPLALAWSDAAASDMRPRPVSMWRTRALKSAQIAGRGILVVSALAATMYVADCVAHWRGGRTLVARNRRLPRSERGGKNSSTSRQAVVQTFQGTAPVPSDRVPADYKAAGVIFYTLDALGEVSRVLLGIEERKVKEPGSVSKMSPVLLFPQGKREEVDKASFIDTARREFIEETGDPTALAPYLTGDPQEGGSGVAWYQSAKMAVVFREVPFTACTRFPPVEEESAQGVPMRPVWVDAMELRKVLRSRSASAEVQTDAGKIPLFKVTRGFFCTAAARRWLAIDKTLSLRPPQQQTPQKQPYPAVYANKGSGSRKTRY